MTRPLAAFVAMTVVAALAPGQAVDKSPKVTPPDEATLGQIEQKVGELREALKGLEKKGTPDPVMADIEVYVKAADRITRHGEFYHADAGRWTVAALDRGLGRAKAAAELTLPWRAARNRPIARAYRSRVDGSVQPYAVTLPTGYGQPGRSWRLDLVLHGRDASLTEVKFLNAKETAKPAADADKVVLEVYGRGNNAYRWAGETDVFETLQTFLQEEVRVMGRLDIDTGRIVLRGFSMGGAGAWHIGLHHPSLFAAVGPGAGFTVTRGYIRNLPARLPPYQEACLHIYDAADYAENVFNVPVVGYSGENDPQIAAARNVEARLKGVSEVPPITHLVAPGLEHKMPPEWAAKAEAKFAKHTAAGRPPHPERVRFVTYTTRYNSCDWVTVGGLDRHYEKAVVDARDGPDGVTVSTANVRVLELRSAKLRGKPVTLDGRRFEAEREQDLQVFVKRDGAWQKVSVGERRRQLAARPEKARGLQGPIDDAFRDKFMIVTPTPAFASDSAAGRHAAAAVERFGREWDKYFRGQLTVTTAEKLESSYVVDSHLILFGEPWSNPVLASVLPKLPIIWTRDKLVVDGKEYDAKAHLPVLIYPNPQNPTRYVVINSGHTFREADLRGTNALLYPRLGDYAVLKPTPTEKDPAAAEVVTAGLFDEFWQFPKK